jgi:hypothetical protein
MFSTGTRSNARLLGDKGGVSGIHSYEMTLPLPNDSILDIVQNGLEPSANNNLKTLVQKCCVSPHKGAELLLELPPNHTATTLVDYYFHTMYMFSPSAYVEYIHLISQQPDPLPDLRARLSHLIQLHL